MKQNIFFEKNIKTIILIPSIIGMLLILFNTKPIIASIIISFTGLILFIFPKIYTNHIYYSNASLYKKMTFYNRFGSLHILLSGIGWFAYFFEIIPPIILEYVYLDGYFMLCFFSLISGNYFVLGFKDDYEQYLKRKNSSLFSNTESSIYNLIWIFIYGFVLFMAANAFIIAFSILIFTGFLIVICPNAIDIKRTKSSQLFTRLGGLMFMIGGGISILIMEHIINEYPRWLHIAFIIISLLMIIGGLKIIGRLESRSLELYSEQ